MYDDLGTTATTSSIGLEHAAAFRPVISWQSSGSGISEPWASATSKETKNAPDIHMMDRWWLMDGGVSCGVSSSLRRTCQGRSPQRAASLAGLEKPCESRFTTNHGSCE